MYLTKVRSKHNQYIHDKTLRVNGKKTIWNVMASIQVHLKLSCVFFRNNLQTCLNLKESSNFMCINTAMTKDNF